MKSNSCTQTTYQVLFPSALQKFRIKALSLFHTHFKCPLDCTDQVILHAFQDSLLTRFWGISAIQENSNSVLETHYQTPHKHKLGPADFYINLMKWFQNSFQLIDVSYGRFH